MRRENVNDLLAFLAVARERSFTRAAAKLGTRSSVADPHHASVSPTEAGERLLVSVGPQFAEIEAEAEVAALSALREKPAGTIRITTGEHAANTILWPALMKLLPHYPDVKVEINVEESKYPRT